MPKVKRALLREFENRKEIQVSLKLSSREFQEARKNAITYCKGNVSAWCRAAINNWKPSTKDIYEEEKESD